MRPPIRDSLHLGAPSTQFDLRGTKTPDLGQDTIIRQTLQNIALAGVNDLANYPDPDRAAPTYDAIANWVKYKDLRPSPDDVALTYGAQNAMIIALQTILVGPTPTIVADELAFPGLRHAANMLRADIVSIERDADGIIPEQLEQICRKLGPQVLVSSFAIHSPTTQVTSFERRRELIQVATKFDLQIIDDDAFGIFETDIPSMYTIAPDRVWYIGALSKAVSTGLRIGYLVTPTGLGNAARATVLSNCYGVSQIICDLATDLITSGQAEAIRLKMLDYCEHRAKFAANILGQWRLDWNPCVPFVWLHMPSGWRASSFQRACEKQNVLVRPADEFALIDGKAPNCARISFGAQLSETDFQTALETIATVLRSPPNIAES